MHRFSLRITAVFLAVFLLFSLIPCLFSASASISYNNGSKGVLCKKLSTDAVSYYSRMDYSELSALSGTALETRLRSRMTDGWSGNSYNDLKTYFKYTDSDSGSQVYCFYSNTKVSSWNREHVWPQSKGTFETGSSTAGSDVIHLRPTDITANSTRSSLPYGEVTGGTYQTVYTAAGKVAGYYSPAYYEPLDSVKGDVARTLLYVYTRWQERNLTDVIASTDLLLKWCEQDPVDEYEMKRNDICEELCGSRNVFVDYPEYCWRVFGKPVPTHMKTPSGSGNTCNSPDYVRAVTTAATCTANGTATCTCRNCGYAYTEVIPSQGHQYKNGVCTVCGKKQAEIQYYKTDSLNAGDEIVIYNPSNKKVISTKATQYTKNNVVYDRLLGATASVAGTELTSTAADIAYFTVQKSGSAYSFKTDDGRYLTCDVSESLTLDANPPTGTNKWTLENSGSDGWYIKNTTTYYQDYQKNYAYVEFYYNNFTTYGFKGTAGAVAYTMQFYKVSRAPVCSHDYRATATLAATCLQSGYTVYTCTKCSDSYTSVTNALGHLYSESVSMPTCTEGGYTEHLCARCGDCYHDSETAALGHNYVNGVCSRCGGTQADPCEGFTDIDRNSWYHSAADYVIDAGIMGSTSTAALTFEPGTACTRAMIVSILYRLNGGPEISYEAIFPDVPRNQWYSDAVIWAYQNGIVKGYDTGYFGPGDRITREQMAVILRGYTENMTGAGISGSAALDGFADAHSVTWSKAAVSWAVANGILSGKTGGGRLLLAPQGDATRAEAASILFRYITGILNK